jgi:hypothetical protein
VGGGASLFKDFPFGVTEQTIPVHSRDAEEIADFCTVASTATESDQVKVENDSMSPPKATKGKSYLDILKIE